MAKAKIQPNIRNDKKVDFSKSPMLSGKIDNLKSKNNDNDNTDIQNQKTVEPIEDVSTENIVEADSIGNHDIVVEEVINKTEVVNEKKSMNETTIEKETFSIANALKEEQSKKAKAGAAKSVYFDPIVYDFVEKVARANNISFSKTVNLLLKQLAQK